MSTGAITFSFANNPIPSPSPSPSSSPSLLNHYPLLLSLIPALSIAFFFFVYLAIIIYSRHRRRRCTQQAVDKIPVTINSAGDGEDDGSCVICLDDLVTGEEVRVLPRCHHVFHKSCIDRWFATPSKVCPMCRDRVFKKEGKPVESINVANGSVVISVIL